MKIYADAPARSSRQLLADLLVLVWVAVWVRLALAVHDVTLTLAAPGRQMSQAGSGMADGLRQAGSTVGDVPLVGEEVRAPFDGAGDAAESLARAGDAQVEAVENLALWLGIVVGVIPILLALAIYLPLRLRFIREATAGQRFLDATGELDLFALRALARQPMRRLGRVTDDPAGAWRRGDVPVIEALAQLELERIGVAPPGR